MSDYTQLTNFAVKDSLTSGNAAKKALGTEVGAEFDAIQVAIATKYDSSDIGIANAKLVVIDSGGVTDGEYARFTANGLESEALITSATFTPTSYVGFSTDPDGDMRYQIIGDGTHKYAFITTADGAALTGTSDTTAFTWAGIPAAARPDVNLTSMSFVATNTGYAQMNAVAQITTAGAVTMAAQPLSGSPSGPWWLNAGWTASGTKGFATGMVIMYPLVITS